MRLRWWQWIVYLCILMLIAALAFFARRDAVASGHDVLVDAIEVTQSVQRPANDVPLVCRRATAVRAFLRKGDGVTGDVVVHGTATVLVDGALTTSTDGVSALNQPFVVPDAPNRENENDTLNFELPAAAFPHASTDVEIRLHIGYVTPVASSGDAQATEWLDSAHVFAFGEPLAPRLFFVHVDLGDPAMPLSEAGGDDVGNPAAAGDRFLRAAFPVADDDALLYRSAPAPIVSFDPGADGTVSSETEEDELLSALASARELCVTDLLAPPDAAYLYGWMPHGTIAGNGMAQVNGHLGFGTTNVVFFQRTFAHEVAHMLGFAHDVDPFVDEVGWDVGRRLYQTPSSNQVGAERTKSPLKAPLMQQGQATVAAWITPAMVECLLGNCAAGELEEEGGETLQDAVQREAAVIAGAFDRTGETVAMLDPVFRFPWSSEPTPRSPDGRYQLVVRYGAGATAGTWQTRFDAFVCVGAGGGGGGGADERIARGAFALRAAVPPGAEIASVRVIDTQDGDVMVDRAAAPGPAPLTVAVQAPLAGSSLSGAVTVAFDVQGGAAGGGARMVHIAFSPTGGEDWVPVAVRRPAGAPFTFDVSRLPKTQGASGVLRVFASDGLRTAFGDATGLEN